MSLEDNRSPDALLHSDLALFLQTVKQTEEQCHRIREYSLSLIGSRLELESNLFIHDQIAKIKIFLTQRQENHASFQAAQTALEKKYGFGVSYSDSATVLVKRVFSKAFDLMQLFCDKLKDSQCELRNLAKVRSVLVSLLNQSDRLRLGCLMKLITDYLDRKMQGQIARLQQIATFIGNGETHKLQTLERAVRSISQSPTKREAQLTLVEHSQKSIRVEREKIRERVRILRQEAAQNEKIRKDKGRIAKLLLKKMSDVMLLARDSFLDSLVHHRPQDQCFRLLQELTSKNHLNAQQINEFRKKEEDFNIKIAAPLSLRSLPLELEPGLCREEENIMENKIESDMGKVIERQSSADLRHQLLANLQKKSIFRRQRVTLNEINSRNSVEDNFESQKQLEGEMVNQVAIRQRLPEIANRAVSVGSRHLEKAKQFVGVVGVVGRGAMRLSRPDIQLKLVRADEVSKTGLELNTISTDFCQEMRRRAPKDNKVPVVC